MPNSGGGSVLENCVYMVVNNANYGVSNNWLFGRCDANLGNFGYVCQTKKTCCDCSTSNPDSAKPGNTINFQPQEEFKTWQEWLIELFSTTYSSYIHYNNMGQKYPKIVQNSNFQLIWLRNIIFINNLKF